eukprot:scaffold10415_cov63-Cylindrotheca_fusiformis.AAC.1
MDVEEAQFQGSNNELEVEEQPTNVAGDNPVAENEAVDGRDNDLRIWQPRSGRRKVGCAPATSWRRKTKDALKLA